MAKQRKDGKLEGLLNMKFLKKVGVVSLVMALFFTIFAGLLTFQPLSASNIMTQQAWQGIVFSVGFLVAVILALIVSAIYDSKYLKKGLEWKENIGGAVVAALVLTAIVSFAPFAGIVLFIVLFVTIFASEAIGGILGNLF